MMQAARIALEMPEGRVAIIRRIVAKEPTKNIIADLGYRSGDALYQLVHSFQYEVGPAGSEEFHEFHSKVDAMPRQLRLEYLLDRWDAGQRDPHFIEGENEDWRRRNSHDRCKIK
jgi:hypothetical protein